PETPAEPSTPEPGTPEPGTPEPGTPEPGTPEPGSSTGGGRPPSVDVTRPAIDLVAPVVKTPFPWIKAAAIAALIGVTGGGLAWFFTRGDGDAVGPASTVTTTAGATAPTETTADTTAPSTTVAPAVTGVALTTSTAAATTLPATVPLTAPPVTAAPTVPTTTRATTPTKTVPATTTTVRPPGGVSTTLPTLITFPVILPPVLLNFGPTISNLLVSPASVSSCGQNVNIQVTLTDTDGVSSANATISYVVAGVTRTANLKLSPLKGNAWAGQLLINLGDAANQPASVKITAFDTKGKSASQSYANKFTVLPCVIG
ncbi:MAG: hypothetical protein RI900_3381, partial [Actinomycetota bacterium]